MANQNPTFPQAELSDEDRRQRALSEVEELASQLRYDLALAASTCDVILAEVRDLRRGPVGYGRRVS